MSQGRQPASQPATMSSAIRAQHPPAAMSTSTRCLISHTVLYSAFRSSGMSRSCENQRRDPLRLRHNKTWGLLESSSCTIRRRPWEGQEETVLEGIVNSTHMDAVQAKL